MVLPGPGHTFEQFRNDDVICQQFAYSQVGGKTANQAAVDSGAGGTGTATGTATQERYDAAYIQCMYAKGHQVPVSEEFSNVMPHHR